MIATSVQTPLLAGSPAARRRVVAPPLPREHGVWAWLLLPLVAAPVAFLPATLKIALALVRRAAADDVRQTGIVEVLHAALFAGLLITAYAVG